MTETLEDFEPEPEDESIEAVLAELAGPEKATKAADQRAIKRLVLDSPQHVSNAIKRLIRATVRGDLAPQRCDAAIRALKALGDTLLIEDLERKIDAMGARLDEVGLPDFGELDLEGRRDEIAEVEAFAVEHPEVDQAIDRFMEEFEFDTERGSLTPRGPGEAASEIEPGPEAGRVDTAPENDNEYGGVHGSFD